jgi:hypothetical protein
MEVTAFKSERAGVDELSAWMDKRIAKHKKKHTFEWGHRDEDRFFLLDGRELRYVGDPIRGVHK